MEFGRTRSGLGAVGINLYDGNLGVGLFAASHYAVVGNETSADLCRRAVQPVLTILQSYQGEIPNHIGLGALSGLGGVLYALCTISQYLKDKSLLERTVDISGPSIPLKQLRSRPLDFAGGTIGYLLGLIRLVEVTGDDTVERRARYVAEYLLDELIKCVDGDRNWIASRRPNLCGLSHGLSGIALVLSVAAQRLKFEELWAFSSLCLETERDFFDPGSRCWPDRRSKEAATGLVPASRWCHGASGIGLTRLELLDLGVQPSSIMSDLEVALEVVERERVISNDSLCCGNFGGVMFLQAASVLNHCSAAGELSAVRARSRVDAASTRGSYAWPAGPDFLNVGLFSGLSGVGLALLRLVQPSTVANPLTLGLPQRFH